MIQTRVRNPNHGRPPLHPTTRGVDDESRTDETFASSSPYLCASVRLVCQWAPHHSAARLQSRPRENLGVWSGCRVRDGKELTRCAASRNSTNYIALLSDIEADHPAGDIYMIDFPPFQPQQCSDSCLDG